MGDVGEWQRKVEVLERHCADVGRDPSEIERSVNVRLMAGADPRSLQPAVQAWKDAGADVCIVYLGTPHDAAVLAPFDVYASVCGAVIAYFASVLVGMAFATPIYAFSAGAETEQWFAFIMRIVIVPMFLFSGTFYPLDAYPEPLRLFVQLTPLYQGVDLLRSLAVGVVGLDDLFHALYLAAIGIAGLFFVSRRLDKLLLK